jgi:4-aminobutyrate aminotransferase-like enzyme
VAYLTNSGSEANDLALRIARAAAVGGGRPGATHVAVVGGAYHGHLTSTMAIRLGPGLQSWWEASREAPRPEAARGVAARWAPD